MLDPALWRPAGPARRSYLAASLRSLDATVGGLALLEGDPVRRVVDAARAVGAERVHVAADFAPHGARRDAAVEQALGEAGIALVRTGSPYAVAPGRLTTQAGTPFQVFTPFRGAWLDHGWSAPARRPQHVPWADVRSDGVPDEPATDVRLPPAGEAAAHAHWTQYLHDGLAEYATLRDRPDLDGTSMLSIPLKYGELHPRTLLADLAEAPFDVSTFRSELAWREFHADVLWHHPGATQRSLRTVVPEDSWDTGSAAFEAWAAGRTGYPFVDAGMRQLRALGWMHNRVRMVVASFLVKDLHVRWQRGAAHFLDWLVDGDISQNQLNWQWVAGTGRDAAPYFRVFNPVSQGEKFDPDGSYVRQWVPELRGIPGRAVHQPWKLGLEAPEDYPPPIVDHAVERKVALDDFHRGRG